MAQSSTCSKCLAMRLGPASRHVCSPSPMPLFRFSLLFAFILVFLIPNFIAYEQGVRWTEVDLSKQVSAALLKSPSTNPGFVGAFLPDMLDSSPTITIGPESTTRDPNLTSLSSLATTTTTNEDVVTSTTTVIPTQTRIVVVVPSTLPHHTSVSTINYHAGNAYLGSVLAILVLVFMPFYG